MSARRLAMRGRGWEEVFVSSAEAALTAGVTDAVARGHSVLLLHGLASGHECESVRAEASSYCSSPASGPRADTGDHPGTTRRHVDDMLTLDGVVTCDTILRRGLTTVHRGLPHLLHRFFGSDVASSGDHGGGGAGGGGDGGDGGADTEGTGSAEGIAEEGIAGGFSARAAAAREVAATLRCDATPLPRPARTSSSPTTSHAPSVVRHPRFDFTPEEPAVNVYAEGGFFSPHSDDQAMTILVPLSSQGPDEAFCGGGTGFWSAADAADLRYSDRPVAAVAAAAAAADAVDVVDVVDVVGVVDARLHDGLQPAVQRELSLSGPLHDGSVLEPTIVLAPPAGSAIVFSGDLTHASLPVTRGERTVLVASMSEAKWRHWLWHPSVWPWALGWQS